MYDIQKRKVKCDNECNQQSKYEHTISFAVGRVFYIKKKQYV